MTRNKDKHIIAAGSLPSIALSPQVRRQFALPMRLIETTAELGRSSGRTAIVGEAAGFLYHARGGLRSTSMHTVTRFCPVFCCRGPFEMSRATSGWIDRLEQGLKIGAVLPATAAAVLGTSVLYGHQLGAQQ